MGYRCNSNTPISVTLIYSFFLLEKENKTKKNKTFFSFLLNLQKKNRHSQGFLSSFTLFLFDFGFHSLSFWWVFLEKCGKCIACKCFVTAFRWTFGTCKSMWKQLMREFYVVWCLVLEVGNKNRFLFAPEKKRIDFYSGLWLLVNFRHFVWFLSNYRVLHYILVIFYQLLWMLRTEHVS